MGSMKGRPIHLHLVAPSLLGLDDPNHRIPPRGTQTVPGWPSSYSLTMSGSMTTAASGAASTSTTDREHEFADFATTRALLKSFWNSHSKTGWSHAENPASTISVNVLENPIICLDMLQRLSIQYWQPIVLTSYSQQEYSTTAKPSRSRSVQPNPARTAHSAAPTQILPGKKVRKTRPSPPQQPPHDQPS